MTLGDSRMAPWLVDRWQVRSCGCAGLSLPHYLVNHNHTHKHKHSTQGLILILGICIYKPDLARKHVSSVRTYPHHRLLSAHPALGTARAWLIWLPSRQLCCWFGAKANGTETKETEITWKFLVSVTCYSFGGRHWEIILLFAVRDIASDITVVLVRLFSTGVWDLFRTTAE